MMRHFHTVLTLTLALLVSATAFADKGDAKADAKKGKKGAAKKFDPTARFFAVPKGVKLSEEQQTQLTDIQKEYSAKVKDAFGKMRDAVPKEKQQARAKARKEAMAAGKKGKELQKAIASAVDLTEEEQKAVKDAQQELQALGKEIKGKVLGLLTAEQKAALKKNAPKKGNKKPANKEEKKPGKKGEKKPVKKGEKTPDKKGEKKPE